MERNNHGISLDGLFRQNIVLMSGLVTAPIIVAATTAERSLALILSFFMMSYTSILICRFIPKKILYAVRVLIYTAVAAVMFIPTALLLGVLFPQTASGVMIYVEILVVNSLLLAKTESRFYLEPYGLMALDALIYTLGYAMAAFVVGVIREVLAYGTIFGLHICTSLMPAAKTPFFGFILLGILAAVCRAIAHSKRRAGKAGES